MTGKVLIAYASEHGATAEIARTIAQILRRNGINAQVSPLRDHPTLADYDAAVIGSAIYMGHWLQDAVTFLQYNALELAAIPTWIFSSGPTGKGDAVDLINKCLIPPDLERVVAEIEPHDVRVFKGRLDLRRVSREEKVILKAAGVPSGDYRNWSAIRDWAQNIADFLCNEEIGTSERA